MKTAQPVQPSILKEILKYDVLLTKKVITKFQYTTLKNLRVHCKFLEISCHGIAWLAVWMAFIWIADSKGLYQMQLNMLFGLLFDIVVIALLKAAFRRRRPAVCTDMLTIGPDKFSFPSGHASRAAFILMFFTCLSPISSFFWLPLTAWMVCVCFSRILMSRHYILDVVGGVILGIFEALFIKLIWFNEDTAAGIINYITNDYIPGPEE